LSIRIGFVYVFAQLHLGHDAPSVTPSWTCRLNSNEYSHLLSTEKNYKKKNVFFFFLFYFILMSLCSFGLVCGCFLNPYSRSFYIIFFLIRPVAGWLAGWVAGWLAA
jgi:hypothetical protein